MKTVIQVIRFTDDGRATKKQEIEIPEFTDDGYFGNVDLMFENSVLVNTILYPKVKVKIS